MAATPTFTAQQAAISGCLFENPPAGVPRAVYWSCTVDFAPMRGASGDSGDWSCALMCDWIAWPIRSWREINGLTLESCVGRLAVEASLYFFGRHQPLSHIELSFQRTHADHFRVRGCFVADLDDLYGRTLQGATAAFDLEGQLAGISVSAENLFPKPNSETQVMDALKPFADLGAYARPEWRETSWLFRPRLEQAAG
jgi:hypothetical protein